MVAACVAGLAPLDSPAISQGQDRDDYRIQCGDTLEVIADVGSQSIQAPPSVIVGPDRRFAFPEVGIIQAEGKTREETAEAIRTPLLRFYRNVVVTVNIKEYRSRQVHVWGEVAQPGAISFGEEGISVERVVALAGGYTANAGIVTLHRAGEPSVLLPMASPGEAPTPLEPGDVLIVAPHPPLAVAGEVVKPGPVQLGAGARLTDVLAAVRGLTAQADGRHAVLVGSGNEITIIDLTQVLVKPQDPINLLVADYRSLVVPPRQSVAVTGQVARPGLYQSDGALGIVDLIAQAGGTTAAAATKVIIGDRDGGSREVDLAEVMANPGSAANALPENVSTVIVPAARNDVVVVGEVARPGVHAPTAMPLRLSAAIAAAGGVTGSADTAQVLVTSADGRLTVVDASVALGIRPVGNDAVAANVDPEITAGATVVVPARHAQVLVLGEVDQPGTYTFADGDTVVDAIGLAGGFSRKASQLRRIGLLRREGTEVEVTRIDLKAGLRGGADLTDGVLHNRDIVFVPREKQTDWRSVVTLLFGGAAAYRTATR